MRRMRIKKGDTVVVISGDDRGKKGRVLKAMPKEGKIIVETVRVVRKHRRARRANEQGGIVEMEAPIDVSNVMLVCPKGGKPTRVSYIFLTDGTKVRSCKKCGEIM